MAESKLDFSKGIPTRVAGTMSGDDKDTRQLVLKTIAELPPELKPKYVDLVPDWENEYDHDAIMAFVDVPTLGRFQIGFVKNSDSTCGFCGEPFSRVPKDGICPICKREDIRRNGMATKISQEMRRDETIRFYAELLEVTGGSSDKPSYGCNILVKKVYKRR